MPDGGLVLLSERSGKLYHCNAIAAAMWAGLEQHDGQLAPVAASIADHYHANPARVRADLDRLVQEWERAGLVGTDS